MSEVEAAQGPLRRYDVDVDTGLRLHVAEWGDPGGLPLLLLHGGAHHSGHFAEVCRRLPDAIRCIVPDARGHGESSWSDSGDYSCQSQVDDLTSLLSELGIHRFVAAGHSMGGLNALLLAGSHPGRALGLVLIDVGSENREEALQHLNDRSPARAAARPSRAHGFDIRLLDHVPTYCGDAETRRRLLRDAAAPLLVLRGARSRIMSQGSAEKTADPVGGEVVEIPDAGHNVATRNPEAVARAIERFVRPHLPAALPRVE
jgi:pimeloyl-ACP methyl ester carboxylesterase